MDNAIIKGRIIDTGAADGERLGRDDKKHEASFAMTFLAAASQWRHVDTASQSDEQFAGVLVGGYLKYENIAYSIAQQ